MNGFVRKPGFCVWNSEELILFVLFGLPRIDGGFGKVLSISMPRNLTISQRTSTFLSSLLLLSNFVHSKHIKFW